MSWLLEYFFGNLDSYVLSAKAEVLVLRSFFGSQFLSICPARAQNVQLIFCSKLSCLHLIKRNFRLDMLKYIGSKISKIFLKYATDILHKAACLHLIDQGVFHNLKISKIVPKCATDILHRSTLL